MTNESWSAKWRIMYEKWLLELMVLVWHMKVDLKVTKRVWKMTPWVDDFQTVWLLTPHHIFLWFFFRVPKFLTLIFTALISLKWTSYSSQPKPSRCTNIKKKFKVCWVCSLKYYRGWDKNSSMNSKFIFKNDD